MDWIVGRGEEGVSTKWDCSSPRACSAVVVVAISDEAMAIHIHIHIYSLSLQTDENEKSTDKGGYEFEKENRTDGNRARGELRR